MRGIHETALPDQRHRYRDPGGETLHDLRGIQSSRWIDDAAFWRHWPGTDHFLEPGASDERTHVGRERARERQYLSLHCRLRYRRVGELRTDSRATARRAPSADRRRQCRQSTHPPYTADTLAHA